MARVAVQRARGRGTCVGAGPARVPTLGSACAGCERGRRFGGRCRQRSRSQAVTVHLVSSITPACLQSPVASSSTCQPSLRQRTRTRCQPCGTAARSRASDRCSAAGMYAARARRLTDIDIKASLSAGSPARGPGTIYSASSSASGEEGGFNSVRGGWGGAEAPPTGVGAPKRCAFPRASPRCRRRRPHQHRAQRHHMLWRRPGCQPVGHGARSGSAAPRRATWRAAQRHRRRAPQLTGVRRPHAATPDSDTRCHHAGRSAPCARHTASTPCRAPSPGG